MKYRLSPAEGIRTQLKFHLQESDLVPLAAVILTSVRAGRVLVLGKITKVPRKRRRRRRKGEERCGGKGGEGLHFGSKLSQKQLSLVA